MTLPERITLLAQAIAGDIKTILANIGSLPTLTTTQKTNLVAAINELQGEVQTLVGSGGAPIDDAAGDGATTVTYSADKVLELLSALEARILGPETAEALNTIKELADELVGQDTALDNLLTAVGNRVRFDAAQALTAPQQLQARQNIGAASAADVGNTDTDYVAVYQAAKA